MLIIAIPKSASTSLLKTFSEIHNISGQQLSFRDSLPAKEFPVLSKFHSDIRELDESLKETLLGNKIFKQHIPPTPNNKNILKGIKKVVLIRNPEDVVAAYFRANEKRIHDKREEFNEANSIEEWKERAKSIGLLDELNGFISGWSNDKNTIIVNYFELVNSPKQVINKIESHFDLPLTKGEVKLARERYSRVSNLKALLSYFKRTIGQFRNRNS